MKEVRVLNYLLLQWIKNNESILMKKGIMTEEIYNTSDNVDNPCTRIDQSSQKYLGRICAWKDGTIDLEIIEIESQIKIMMAHYSVQEQVECFIDPYLKIMGNNI